MTTSLPASCPTLAALALSASTLAFAPSALAVGGWSCQVLGGTVKGSAPDAIVVASYAKDAVVVLHDATPAPGTSGLFASKATIAPLSLRADLGDVYALTALPGVTFDLFPDASSGGSGTGGGIGGGIGCGRGGCDFDALFSTTATGQWRNSGDFASYTCVKI